MGEAHASGGMRRRCAGARYWRDGARAVIALACLSAALNAGCAPRVASDASPLGADAVSGVEGTAEAPTAASRAKASRADASPRPGPETASRAEAASLVELEVPGYLPALLRVPGGDDERPLVAAAHGAGGAPEWECEYWRRLVGDRAFVLCLRGTRMGEGSYYFKQHHALAEELDRALAAARERYPRIAAGSGIYAGFSQGASMGSLMIAERAKQFPYVVLIEGFVLWNVALGRSFSQRGGAAILWACGTRDCASKAEGSATAVGRSGVRVHVEHAGGAGHTPLGPVMAAVSERLLWLVQDDPLWRSVLERPAVRGGG